jgi:pilus assembly protein CpaB
MRMVFGLVLLLGLALAGFAVYMARDFVGSYQAQLDSAQANAVQTVQVFVVNRPVKYGERLLLEDVRMVPFPVDALPEGAFKAEAELFSKGPEVLRTVLRSMEKDEVVLAVKVTEPGEDAGVASRLEKNMRAFAIRVDVSSGVSGFLRPGDRVDVYWTGQSIGTQLGGSITKLIETGVKLIAVDQTADGDSTAASIARTVTVEATPQQVAALAQAQSTGALSLSLLGATDTSVAEATDVDQNALLGIEEQAVAEVVAPAAPERICTIKSRHGTEVVETPIACAD